MEYGAFPVSAAYGKSPPARKPVVRPRQWSCPGLDAMMSGGLCLWSQSRTAAMTDARRLTLTILLGLAAIAAVPAEAAMAQARSADAENRRVRVHNQTGWTLTALQAADPRTGTFGADLLARTPLEAGQSRPLLIDDGAGTCVFTLRASFTNGQTLERPGVNVCRIADWYLTR